MSLWVPHPSTIVPVPNFGREDMGAIEEPTSPVGRYELNGDRFCVTGFQAGFGNSEKVSDYQAVVATGEATLRLYNDTRQRPNIVDIDSGTNELIVGVFQLEEWPEVGIDGLAWLNVSFDPQRFITDMLFQAGDQALFTWTNPESSRDMTWNMRVLLAPVPDEALR